MQFVFGFVAGAFLTGVVIWKMMPKLMIFTRKSAFDYDKTLELLQNEAKKAGWNVPHVYDMKKSFEKAGAANVERMHVISLGNGKHA